MNVGKSIKIALTQREKDVPWLAEKMEVSETYVYALQKKQHANGSTIDKIAGIFELESSDFIKLGEFDQEK